MDSVDKQCIAMSIESGGIITPLKKAQQAGTKLVKNLWKINQKHETKEKLKDYKYSVLETFFNEEMLIVMACQTPQGGFMTLRWTNTKGETFLPKKVFLLCEKEDGQEILPIFSFGKSEKEEDIPEGAQLI